ncbi:efflux transporter outer membrane subunit [Mucilaginibacter gynuensis]
MRKIKNILIAVGTLLTAGVWSACKVAKDIEKADAVLPAVFRNNADNTADSTSAGDVHWRTFFVEQELKDLIDSALHRNNDLLIAIRNIEAADLQLRQAKQGNTPIIGVQATASTNRPSDNSLNGLSLTSFLGQKHVEDYTLAPTLSWEADIWGKVRSRKAAALATYLRSGEARKLLQTQLINNVSKGYYNLLLLDAQIAIAKRNVLLNDSTLSIILLQYNAGQVSSLAVQRAETQKLAAERLIPQFEQAFNIQENALSILCGRLPGPVLHKRGLRDLEVNDQLNAGIPSDLLKRRPDVRQAELALAESNALVGYAKANMYPSLTITAQGGLDAFKASNWFNIPASLFGTVVGGITQPVLNQRKLRTAYQTALVRREQSVIAFRQSVLLAVGDVSDALISINKLKEEELFLQQRARTLNSATRNAQLLFSNGLANYLEVITAQENVLQSELDLAIVRRSRLDAVVDLYRSLGGGR